jgi:hypothetical protein
MVQPITLTAVLGLIVWCLSHVAHFGHPECATKMVLHDLHGNHYCGERK